MTTIDAATRADMRKNFAFWPEVIALLDALDEAEELADDVAKDSLSNFNSAYQQRLRADALSAKLETAKKALKDARPYVHSFARFNEDIRAKEVCADIDAALAELEEPKP